MIYRVVLKSERRHVSLRRPGASLPHKLELESDQEYYLSEADYLLAQPYVDLVSGGWKLVKKSAIKVYSPDGIGDLHWVFTKLGALAKASNATKINLFVRDLSPKRPQRVLEFAFLNPLISSASYTKDVITIPPEGFLVNSRGYDYCLDPTPVLMSGQKLSDWLPSIGLELPYKTKPIQSSRVPGNVVICAGNEQSYESWAGSWTLNAWASVIKLLTKANKRVHLVGLPCDQLFAQSLALKCRFTNLIGKSTFLQVMSLILGSDVFISTCNGLSIYSAYLGQPTVTLWPGLKAKSPLPESFWYAGIPSQFKTYAPLSYDSSVSDIIRAIAKVWRKS